MPFQITFFTAIGKCTASKVWVLHDTWRAAPGWVATNIQDSRLAAALIHLSARTHNSRQSHLSWHYKLCSPFRTPRKTKHHRKRRGSTVSHKHERTLGPLRAYITQKIIHSAIFLLLLLFSFFLFVSFALPWSNISFTFCPLSEDVSKYLNSRWNESQSLRNKRGHRTSRGRSMSTNSVFTGVP